MKKIFFFTSILFLTSLSCSEEELVLDGDTDTNEVAADDNTDETEDDNGSNDDTNSSGNVTSIVNEILRLTNEHRQSVGTSTLSLNDVATELAIEHTNYMISKNDISHDGFSNRFQELQQQVNAKSAGENVASGYAAAESVMYAWLNSDGHRANIEGNFTHIGIAAIKNAEGRLFFTQLFYR